MFHMITIFMLQNERKTILSYLEISQLRTQCKFKNHFVSQFFWVNNDSRICIYLRLDWSFFQRCNIVLFVKTSISFIETTFKKVLLMLQCSWEVPFWSFLPLLENQLWMVLFKKTCTLLCFFHGSKQRKMVLTETRKSSRKLSVKTRNPFYF